MKALTSMRRWYWRHVRRYAYEMCDCCGHPVASRAFGLIHEDEELAPRTYWFADNHVWNRVVGSEVGVLCPRCFTEKAEAMGVPVGWRCGIVGEIEP